MDPEQQSMREIMEEYAKVSGQELLFLDGHDNAIMGLARQFNTESIAYNKRKVIENLCLRGDMDHEEANEFFEFNIVGSYVGEHTPTFIDMEI